MSSRPRAFSLSEQEAVPPEVPAFLLSLIRDFWVERTRLAGGAARGGGEPSCRDACKGLDPAPGREAWGSPSVEGLGGLLVVFQEQNELKEPREIPSNPQILCSIWRLVIGIYSSGGYNLLSKPRYLFINERGQTGINWACPLANWDIWSFCLCGWRQGTPSQSASLPGSEPGITVQTFPLLKEDSVKPLL